MMGERTMWSRFTIRIHTMNTINYIGKQWYFVFQKGARIMERVFQPKIDSFIAKPFTQEQIDEMYRYAEKKVNIVYLISELKKADPERERETIEILEDIILGWHKRNPTEELEG